MKRKFMTVMTLLLCLVTAFGFTACGDKDNGGGNGGSGAGTKVPLGTAVQQVVTATLQEQYVNVNIDADMQAAANKGAVLQGDVNAKKATGGYDYYIKFNATPKGSTAVQHVQGWIIDGVSYGGTSTDGEEYQYKAQYAGTFDELLEIYNVPVTMQTLPGMLEQIKQVGGEVEKKDGKYAFSLEKDLTADLNKEIAWLKTNRNKPIGEAIAVRFNKTAAQLDADLAEVFVAEQTVTDVVGKLNTLLGKYGFTQTLKQMLDSVQKLSGMTASEIVELLQSAGGNSQAPSPADAQATPGMSTFQWPAVTPGQTLYDYLLANFGDTDVDTLVAAFTQQEMETLAEVYAYMVKPALFGDTATQVEAVQLGAAIDTLLERFESEITSEMIAALNVNSVKGSVSIEADAQNRLTKLNVAYTVDVADVSTPETPVKVFDMDYDIKLALTYNADNAAKIAFPANAEIDPMIKSIGEEYVDATAARTSGYTMDIYPGHNTQKTLTVYQMAIRSSSVPTVMITANEAGEFKAQGSDTVYATQKNGKIVLNKEIFQMPDVTTVRLDIKVESATSVNDTYMYVYVGE